MKRSSSRELVSFLLVFIIAAALSGSYMAGATDHIVGGHLGWNPNINYTDWSTNQTFYVGDLISFRYQKNVYNVFEVNNTGYDNCTLDSAVGNWSSGKDFIPLDSPGMYYFICGNGQCFSGMKVAVKVVPLHSPPGSSSSSSTRHSGSDVTTSAATSVTLSSATLVWAAMLAVAHWL